MQVVHVQIGLVSELMGALVSALFNLQMPGHEVTFGKSTYNIHREWGWYSRSYIQAVHLLNLENNEGHCRGQTIKQLYNGTLH